MGKRVLVSADLFEDMQVCVPGSGAIFPVGLSDFIDPQNPPDWLVEAVARAIWRYPKHLWESADHTEELHQAHEAIAAMATEPPEDKNDE